MPFFNATEAFLNQLNDFFVFLWPSQIALWHLRKEINTLSQDIEHLTNQDLIKRFAKNSGIHSANLLKACVNINWDEQVNIYSRLMLVNVIAMYEGLASEILNEMKLADKDSNKLRLDHKYGRKAIDSLKDGRIMEQLEISREPISEAIYSSIYPTINSNDKYDKNVALNRMKCFRCFKEIRNCLIHNNGFATKKCEESYNAYSPIASPADLHIKKEPICGPILTGDQISITIYGVVGFSDLLIKMALSIDAELSYAKVCENILVEKFEQKKIAKRTLNKNQATRLEQVKRLIRKSGLPTPINVTTIEKLLLSKSLVTI